MISPPWERTGINHVAFLGLSDHNIGDRAADSTPQPRQTRFFASVIWSLSSPSLPLLFLLFLRSFLLLKKQLFPSV